MKIGVIGANGFIGSRLVKELIEISSYNIVSITRDNFLLERENYFDILINCAMPSKKYWANLKPLEDF